MHLAAGLMASLRGLRARWRPPARIGGNDVADARRIADLERGAGATPPGCSWLDDRTIEDLDLGQVFGAIDRTRTASGAQVLWRWLVAPAHDPALLATRERKLALLADPALRDQLVRRLGSTTIADAPLLPNLLWAPAAQPLHWALIRVLAFAMLACVVLARFWLAPALVGVAVVFFVNVVVDDWAKLRLAHQAVGLEALDHLLQRATALARELPAELRGEIQTDLAPAAALHRRQGVLRVRDPIGLFDLVRAGFLVRLAVSRSSMRIVEAERARLRRIVVWFGELDALAAIAALRAERPELCVPELEAGPAHVAARGLVHPAIAKPIGNEVELGAGLIVTGDNMSGKSTFLRTIAVNAILAQSIHTTCGAWRSSILRVRTVMRIADEPARQLSTYAVEVAAMGELLAETGGDTSVLFVLDEPFHGTSPTIRVPIVLGVLEYLVTVGIVVAATHDLEVANRLGDRFARGYFQDDGTGAFDRRLRAGIAPGTNAVEILRRAGYPARVLDTISRFS